MTATVEFYREGEQSPFCTVEAAFQPNDGDLVNIKKQTWEVIGRSFTVDHPIHLPPTMRCNVIVRARPS